LIIVSATGLALMKALQKSAAKPLRMNRLPLRTKWCANSRAEVAETMIKASFPIVSQLPKRGFEIG
jgi:hypothetical protein